MRLFESFGPPRLSIFIYVVSAIAAFLGRSQPCQAQSPPDNPVRAVMSRTSSRSTDSSHPEWPEDYTLALPDDEFLRLINALAGNNSTAKAAAADRLRAMRSQYAAQLPVYNMPSDDKVRRAALRLLLDIQRERGFPTATIEGLRFKPEVEAVWNTRNVTTESAVRMKLHVFNVVNEPIRFFRFGATPIAMFTDAAVRLPNKGAASSPLAFTRLGDGLALLKGGSEMVVSDFDARLSKMSTGLVFSGQDGGGGTFRFENITPGLYFLSIGGSHEPLLTGNRTSSARTWQGAFGMPLVAIEVRE
jgi:hypothetical protein